MKKERQEVYEQSMKAIKESKLAFVETSPTVCSFDVVVDDKPAKAVFYASTERLIVALAKINEPMSVIDAMEWIKDHQA